MLPRAAGAATVADSVGSRLPILSDQVQNGEQESADLLVTGLTGFGLSLAAEFGSAPTRADPLPGPE
jgi:hypothetical protein